MSPGLPWTTLRATQFHDLLLTTVRQMAKMPVIPVLSGFRAQPVDADEVAARLVDLALGPPAGLVPDIAGPKGDGMAELLRGYLRARGKRRAIVPVRLPGEAARAFWAGANLAPDRAVGRQTWEDFWPTRLCDDLRVARVTGIGGFFFRARDPDALNRWYAEHLGVVMIESRGYDDPGWFQDRGETVFSAFSPDSDAFGSPEKTWKINFRVSDLDGMIEQLRAAGIDVRPHDREYPNGRFAELADPEGNRIQLWEPNAASLARDPERQRVRPTTRGDPDPGGDPLGRRAATPPLRRTTAARIRRRRRGAIASRQKQAPSREGSRF